MTSPRLRRLWSLARRLAAEWRDDRVPDLAAEVAFYAILSLFPALLALAALLGVLEALVGAEVAVETQAEAIAFLRTILTSEADTTIEAVTELFTKSRPGLLTFSLLAALWALSRGFAALVRALDVVYDVEELRPWLRVRTTAFLLAIGSIAAGAVMLSVLVVGPLFGTGEEIASEVGLGEAFVFLWDVLRLPTAFVMLVLWAATIFHLGPDRRTPWRADLPGALVTGVLWVVFSGGLRAYVELAQRGNVVYGALGGVLIVMLWFWLLSLGVLLGGEVNQLLLAERSAGVERGAQGGDGSSGVHRTPAVEEDAHDR